VASPKWQHRSSTGKPNHFALTLIVLKPSSSTHSKWLQPISVGCIATNSFKYSHAKCCIWRTEFVGCVRRLEFYYYGCDCFYFVGDQMDGSLTRKHRRQGWNVENLFHYFVFCLLCFRIMYFSINFNLMGLFYWNTVWWHNIDRISQT